MNVTVLPADLPERLQTVIRQCLQKDPKRRIRDVGDVTLAMEGAFETAVGAPSDSFAVPQPRVWQRPAPAAIAAIALLLIGGLAVWSFTRPEPSDLIRFTIVPPDTAQPDFSGAFSRPGDRTRWHPDRLSG